MSRDSKCPLVGGCELWSHRYDKCLGKEAGAPCTYDLAIKSVAISVIDSTDQCAARPAIFDVYEFFARPFRTIMTVIRIYKAVRR